MKQSKTLQILRSFSTWERKSLHEYILSPFFNKNQKVVSLYEHLLSFAPDYEQGELSMEAVAGHLFPGEKFDGQKMRYLMTDLTRLCEGFLAYKKWEGDPFAYKQFVLQAFEERELAKPYEEKSRKLEKVFIALDGKSHAGFNDRFLFTERTYNASRTLLHGRSSTHQLSEVMQVLDELYLVKKLRYSCELINQSNVLNKHYDFFLTQELMDQMAANPDLGSRLARLYYHALLSLQEEDETQYFKLKKLLAESVDSIAHQDLSDLYICALNFCIKQYNRGKSGFRTEMFELYKVLIVNRVLFVKEQLPEQHFKNIVTLGVLEEAYDWTEDFINEYRQYLPEEEAENAFAYNMAFLKEKQGNYREVKRLLMSIEFTNLFYQLGSRAILVRTYYELGDYEALLYLLGSFRIFLRRNRKVTDTRRKAYLKLIRITNQLVRYQLGARVSIRQIEDLLKANPDVAAVDWLQKKVTELKN